MALIFTHLDALATFGDDCSDLTPITATVLTGEVSAGKDAFQPKHSTDFLQKERRTVG